MFDNMTEDMLIEKWSNSDLKKLAVGGIEEFDKRAVTARILENISNYDFSRNPFRDLMNESQSSVAPNSTGTGLFSPISLAIARRVTPELFAWKCVGVQPMSGPVGLAYAMRFKYQGLAQEAGFDDMDLFSTFTGNLSGTSGVADTGTGVNTATAEGWQINGSITSTTPMPQLVYSMESVAITAKTRKLAANISLETLMDVKAMHNIDVKREMVAKLQYQIRGEVDRELLYNIKTQSTTIANGGETVTTWQTSASDGRWQQEKFNTVANVIIQKANDVGVSTRIDSANFAIVSPRVATALQACGARWNGNNVSVNNSNTFAEIGTLGNQVKVYIDRYARTDYATVGLKGQDGQNECGVVYSPYVLGLESEATTQEDFSPRMGVMSRYAITNSLLGAGRYYRSINFINLNGIMQA